MGGSDKPESRVFPRGANGLPWHLESRMCGNGGTTRRHVRAVFEHQGHEGLQGIVPKRGACPPLNFSDYIDHFALMQGFTYLNNLKYSLTSLALAMLACLPSLLIYARECAVNHPQGDSQETNHQARKQRKNTCLKKKGFRPCRGGVRVRVNLLCAPSSTTQASYNITEAGMAITAVSSRRKSACVAHS